MDRDLKIGGRVVVNDNGKLKMKLYASDGAIATIPNLCIHLSDNKTKGGDFKEVDKETQLRVVFSHESFDGQLEGPENPDHYNVLFQDICNKLNCKMEDILDFDLCFADAHDPAIIGFNKEFIASPRLDNLFSSWAALETIDTTNSSNDINIAAMFDHEEIGSTTITGADSRTF